MLRDDAAILLDSDYVDGARLVAVEFVNMMADLDRLADVTHLDARQALTYMSDVLNELTGEMEHPPGLVDVTLRGITRRG
jgi:hypothetical protein